ncbi:MAG: alcohol dehydrogenase catalytic domain-containing protein, partial [Planctomycetota bacterium]
MRAWRLDRVGEPLRLVELADPEPGPGEILLELSVCGLCRTDIHICDGEIELPVLPIVPGHQGVGRVAARGSGAARFELGTRVGVAWLRETCSDCADCARGDENLCRQARFSGYHLPGCFADKVVLREEYAYALPDSLDDLHTAPLLCAGIIGYRALRQADVSGNERVGLYGFGSSAHIALQVARAHGNEVYVVTRGARH